MPSEAFVQVEVFPWSSNFELGIKSIDAQHQKLVSIINTLAWHLVNHSEEIILDAVFDELIAYTNFHFSDEEQIWQRCFAGDALLTKHKKSHEKFLSEVLAFKSDFQNQKQDDILKKLVSYLTIWLARHILDEDKRMALVLLEVDQGVSLEVAKQHSNNQTQGDATILINTVLSMYDKLTSRTIDLMREKSKRLKAEEELQKNEEKWKLILNAKTEDIWHWDIPKNELQTIIEKHQVKQILDDSHKFESETSSIHPDDIERAERELQEHLDGKTELFINTHRIIRSDGTCHWIMTRGRVLERTKSGKPLRMVGVHLDITERELAVNIYNNSKQSMIVCNAQNQILSVNPAFVKTTGYEPSEAIGKNPNILSSGLQSEQFYEAMWQNISIHGYWKGSLYDKRKNGEVFPINLEIIAIRDLNKKPNMYIAISEDITELVENKKIVKRQENKLVQQSRMAMMGEMISMIAHQWRQPLGAIGSTVLDMELKLEMDFFDFDNVAEQKKCIAYFQESLSDITEFVKVLTTTIDDFRNFYKIQNQTQELRIDEPVHKALKIVNCYMVQDSIHLEESYNSTSIVSLYASEMMQVVITILRNAQKNFKIKKIKNPSIKIRSYEDEKSIFLEISDNGGGVPEALQSKIFDPYFTTKSATEGTGLGLHMSKTIIEEHHDGKISVKNTDDGASFLIELPKRRES